MIYDERLDRELAGFGDMASRAPAGDVIYLPGIATPINRDTPIHAEKAPNFTWYEATHGFTRIPDKIGTVFNIIKVAKILQEIRDHIGEPLFITSWYRTPYWNDLCGGAIDSRHLHGDGVDFYANSYNYKQMYDLASSIVGDRGGVGKYRNNTITHIDARGYRARWYS